MLLDPVEMGDNQMNTVHLTLGLSGLRVTGLLHRRVRLGMHCKVEIIGFDTMSISPDNP